MNEVKVAVVITSISAPNPVLCKIAEGSQQKDWDFIVIGDVASPKDFALEGCDFYGIERQHETPFKFARLCPEKHYARKNIGYLLARQGGADMIIETDDDNIPYESFWQQRDRVQTVPTFADERWVNAYRYFSDENIWPRGFPLNLIHDSLPSWSSLPVASVDCPIQQGLANENPDVDALYRLILPLPQSFYSDRRLALQAGAWCPFNSQNTTWWPEVYPLMYLPAYCSFRMTDIWRSFIAQRILWTADWGVLFHEPTVYQERNDHDLMKDFQEEIPGYLQNHRICEALAGLNLRSGAENVADNLRICYEKLVSLSIFPQQELDLVEAWLSDLALLNES
ncbi:STELLO glycosyltransferase family protein [Oscillatoria sp. FACHB-1406]|uniref:STELLO glycosyltransferase family protein n=1 Tax=Oscillatoria sp. FACHB-1406 TaxID=2692846 RepID=UPI0016883225|nr:STELLO glycosyltransferase family protein [Oscillatoria sp. FACHB-1406]MBD2580419.1 DUF288 domain-containing protein [Oscillatoria sp. FACHB-1406]